MAYKHSKKTTTGKGYRQCPGNPTYRKPTLKSLDILIEKKIKQALSQLKRGPPRSVYVRLLPCEVDRTLGTPQFKELTNNNWPTYLKGPLAERKYALLPISELISSRLVPASIADGGQHAFDTVFIKGVSIRMSICHAEDVRLMLFAFRNGNRKDFPPTMVTRPFEVVKDGSEVASQVQYEVLTKDRLGGIVDNSEKHNSTRHLGYDDGHFRVHGNAQGYPERKSDDGSAFTSRLSKEKGKPVGKVQVRVDSGSAKQCRSICNMTMSPSTPGQAGVGASGVRMRSRQVEFFVSLNRRERFQAAGGSRSVSERPLELFIGFDGKPSEIHSSDAGSVCAAITGMDMEVYYNLTED